MTEQKVREVVLAYSGGLDTSVIVPWLRENYDCEVVCFTADVGQGEELNELEEKAIASGANKLVVWTCARSSPVISSSPCSNPVLSTNVSICSAPRSPAP